MPRTEEARKLRKTAPKTKSRRQARLGGISAGNRRQSADEEKSYWMRCPRCGLGLIETVTGPITTERCTACAAVWADPEDVKDSPEADAKRVFRL